MKRSWSMTDSLRMSLMVTLCACGDLNLGNAGYFSSGFETGDESEWTSQADGASGGPYTLRGGTFSFVPEPVRSGTYALSLDLPGRPGTEEHAGILRKAPPAEEAHFSAHYFFPRAHAVALYWYIFQFRSATRDHHAPASDVHWGLNVENDAQGNMYLGLRQQLPVDDWKSFAPLRTVALPVGRWVHVEVRVVNSPDDSGRITVWQDGERIFDVPNVRTLGTRPLNWLVTSIGRDVTPTPVRLFVDDAAITTLPMRPR